jgi:hypothetical protein
MSPLARFSFAAVSLLSYPSQAENLSQIRLGNWMGGCAFDEFSQTVRCIGMGESRERVGQYPLSYATIVENENDGYMMFSSMSRVAPDQAIEITIGERIFIADPGVSARWLPLGEDKMGGISFVDTLEKTVMTEMRKHPTMTIRFSRNGAGHFDATVDLKNYAKFHDILLADLKRFRAKKR